MTHKSQESYAATLNYLSQRAQELIPNVPRPIKWEQMLIDYESGLLPALQQHDFGAPPALTVKGCHFHHVQSVWRQVQREGLAATYRTVPAVRNVITGLFAIAFLPVAEVEAGFNEFITTPSIVLTRQNYPRLTNLFQYYDNVWLQGQYAPATWNVHNSGDIRTNNNIEGYHRDMKDYFKKHPSFWVFLKKLHDMQKKEEVWFQKIQSGNRRAIAAPRRLEYQRKELSLQQLIEDYDNHGFADRVSFIQQIAQFQGTSHDQENIRADDYAEADADEPVQNDDADADEDDEYDD